MKSVIRIPFLMGGAALAFLMNYELSQHYFAFPEEEEDGIEAAMEQERQLTEDPALHRIPKERLLPAAEYRTQRVQTAEMMNLPVSGINWTERGPSNIGGRTRAILFDLNDAPNYRKIWAGGVGGGLWYTNDITVSAPQWNKVNDLLDNLAISCIAQSSVTKNVLYFGTGEGWYNSDAQQGLGIWKSSDGGASWSQLASTNNSIFYYVQKMVVDDQNNVFACTRSGGVQKSSDGGATWTKVLGSGVNGGVHNAAADIELAPNGDLYCSLGILNTGKIYRSADRGVTWSDISPASLSAQRIELATSAGSSDVLYALAQGSGSYDCNFIQRYQVSANTWTNCSVPTIIDQGSNSPFTRSQAWYDLIAAVDPNNPNSLYIGGIDALRSDDGGVSWTQMTTWSLYAATGFSSAQNVHADQHAIVYAPGSSSRAVWGTDGGIFYTANANITGTGNKPTWVSKNTGYNVTQYYSGALHPTSANYFLAGAQDNGTHKFSTAGINAVTEASGGDGGFCHIDKDNPAVQITSYVYNNYYVSTNGGSSFASYSKNSRGKFINASDYDNQNNILYAGDAANSFYRWTNPAANGADAQVVVSGFSNSQVSHVAVSPITSNRVFFGLYNGSVVMVDNAHTGTSLSGTVIKPATSGVVSCIAIDPANENHLLVTYTSYGVMHVFETTSALLASPAWTAVGGNLPDMPVRWAIFDPRNSDWAILATELGVWSTNNLNGASTDWSPTNSGFANVRVDMLDYRASDGTLLAATHGRGVFTATIPASTTPDINFTSSNTAATEQTAASASCRGYKDYTLTMTIANAPVGDATVNLQIEAGNAATRGVDFEFTTNGNFSSSSSSLVFANGATTSKNITIRIYDDAEVESTESFKLIYTITGATNAVPGSGPQSHTVSIYDDDQAPVEGGSAAYTVVTNPTYNLGSTTDGTGAGQPFDAKLQFKKTQFLYKASELTAAGMKAGSITSIQFLFAFKNSTRPYKNLQVKLGTTTLNYLVDGMVNVIATSTYGTMASFSPVLGWNSLPLSTPFTWDGTSNIAVEICYDNGSAASGDKADILTGYSDGGSFSQGNIFWQDNLSCSGSYSTVTYYAYGSKPEIRFGSEVTATPIATVLNTSQSEYLGPYADVYFYSATGEILARIKNLTSHDYGCTQVYLDRAGTSALPFWSNFVPDYVMSKTFKVVPTNNNSAGQYQITLYYTKAEVEGWQQLTGQMFTNINLVKVSGRVADVTPANPTGSGTIQSVAPTRGNFGVNYTLTYTFTTGFSGFGAGNIVGQALPMQLLNFTAQATDVGTLLNWSTSFEMNSKEYVIQRSEDGSHFSDIGNVSAAGNSSTERHYTYTDRTAEGTLFYYRLKQVSLDELSSYSKIIRVQKEQKNSTPFKLLYNPITKNTLEIEFGMIPGDRVQLMVADVSGKNLLTKDLMRISGTRQQVVLPPYLLSNGVYILRVQTPGRIYSLRFIKSF